MQDWLLLVIGRTVALTDGIESERVLEPQVCLSFRWFSGVLRGNPLSQVFGLNWRDDEDKQLCLQCLHYDLIPALDFPRSSILPQSHHGMSFDRD